ncbi:MFS transporter [soil metagenome]
MSSSAPARARWAVALVFFLHGYVWGSWVPHIPLAKEKLGVGPGLFGVALLALAAGAISAMPPTGILINRYGSAKVTAVSGIAFCTLLMAPVLAPSFPLFLVLGFAFGATLGSMDVAMNAHGIAVERAFRRPTMSFFHGAFSVGGTAGAFIGAALLLYVSSLTHILLSAGLCLILLLGALPAFLPNAVDKGLSGTGFAWPTRATIGLGLLCFLALMAEGSVTDWSGIMLRDRFALSPESAALGYGLFSAGMAVSRFTGDRLRTRVGSVLLVRASALLAALGLAGAAALPWPFLAIACFGFAGIGVGNLVPILFAGGGRLEPDAPGRGIAAVTSLGYAGFLAGPPLIGFAAEATNLPVAFGLVVIATLVIAMSAVMARSADEY